MIKIKDAVEWRESDTTDCLQPNLIKPTERNIRREEFWKDYYNAGIKKVLSKDYTVPPIWRRVARKAKRVIKGILGK